MGNNMQSWIEKLKLERHVEGGYFGLVYQSTDKIITQNKRYNTTERTAGSSIYFLLEKNDFSAWHQLKSDEIWHYYDGEGGIHIHTIDLDGNYVLKVLGHPMHVENGTFQVAIPAGTWFAAELINKLSFGLVGCTVSPGFDYQDFTLADRDQLVSQYATYAELIHRLTRVVC